jgi:SAM-dependent methyltransferase
VLTINFHDFPLRDGDVVVDVGCGEGRHAINAYLEADVISIGVDLSHRDLCTSYSRYLPFQKTNAIGGFYLQQTNAMHLPFANNSIDKIICSEVLEHVPNYEAVIDELHRVLKPGGLLAISVPRAWPERLCWWLSRAYHEVEGGHLRIFNAQHLKRRIEARSLRYYATHHAHALHSPYWWLRCAFWSTQDTNPIVNIYHRFLVWDLMDKPWITRVLERALNPLLGKSVVMYFEKPIKDHA